jgi:Cu(I)/Ag(I) efflux system protein CusF
MKTLYTATAVLGLALTLAACGPQKAAESAPAPVAATPAPDAMAASNAPAAAPAGDMSKMDMSPSATMAKGSGVVTAIDKTAGTITLKHGPIPEAKWPAMTMAFKADPASLLDTVKVGDKVDFDLMIDGASSEVTAIRIR